MEPTIDLDFTKAGGLVTAVTVDAATGDVLMVAGMNAEAFELTRSTGFAHYWSRSRGALWKKGESSGNLQRVIEIRVDCDADAVLLRVEQQGPACHEGYRSCFFRSLDADGSVRVLGEPLRTPEQMYGAQG